MRVIVYRQEDLDTLNEVLHGHWVDVEQIERRGDAAWIPVSAKATAKASENDFQWALIVAPIRQLDVHDDQGIRYYDFERLELERDRQALRLVCNIPVRIHLEMGELPARLELRSPSEG